MVSLCLACTVLVILPILTDGPPPPLPGYVYLGRQFDERWERPAGGHSECGLRCGSCGDSKGGDRGRGAMGYPQESGNEKTRQVQVVATFVAMLWLRCAEEQSVNLYKLF